MLELLYASLIVLGISIIPFFIFASFQNFRIYLFLFQFIISLILIFYRPYKQHSLWNDPEYQQFQKTPYDPIINIYGKKLDYEVAKDNTFSIIKTDLYSKECLENYFIKNNETCPITEIIIESNNNSDSYIGYETLKVEDAYVFYKRDKKHGKLYQYIAKDENYYSYIKYTCISSFDYTDVQKIIKKEDNKSLKPFHSFKSFIRYSDLICLELFIFSFIYFLMESRKDLSWNYFRIIDYCM